jgi:hypothetical protein
MGKERNYYEVIKEILLGYPKDSYDKETIKEKIVDALEGDDYITAITAYLWGAYNSFDSDAKTAFKTVFHDDLKKHNPSAFYFFSFYFLNDFKRAGFDRRTDSDRRTCYSLDFFGERIIERRQGGDRRKDPEKRLNWTRVTKWVSVPFNADAGNRVGGEGMDSSPEETSQKPNHDMIGNLPANAEMDIRSLNLILSSLILYFESHIKHGQTAWLNNLDEEIFARAKNIMRDLIDR